MFLFGEQPTKIDWILFCSRSPCQADLARLTKSKQPTATMTPSNNQTTNSGCPFRESQGYSTKDGRLQYLVEHGISDSNAKTISSSVEADMDRSKPLYFWQLYSLIGHEPIIEIVKDFYKRVYADDEESWFRNAFSRIGGVEYHVQAQAMYWIDAFGGGKVYHGGSYRLSFHHHHNASEVMNAIGARRWMHHMRGALESQKFEDPRVLPCIVDFLSTKMKTYAKEHEWEYDESDFDFAKSMISTPQLQLDDRIDSEKSAS